MTTPKRDSAPLMDWEKVAENEKAFSEWLKWFWQEKYSQSRRKNLVDALRNEHPNSLIGHLLSFFREHELYVIHAPYYTGWRWAIRYDFDPGKGNLASNVGLGGYDPCETANQALAAAFMEAFRVLEGRMEDDQ